MYRGNYNYGYPHRVSLQDKYVQDALLSDAASHRAHSAAANRSNQQKNDSQEHREYADWLPTGSTFVCPVTPPARRHKCDDCGVTFASVDDLQVHTLTAHHQEVTGAPPPYVGGFRFEAQPVNLDSVIMTTGEHRGIQGQNNSCYLDSSLMAMFYANDTFDSLLVRAGEGNTQQNDQLEYARRYMMLHIVNHVRQRGYVPSGLVVEWRRMISPWFGSGVDFDTHCEEEEASEFVRFLLEHFGGDTVKFVVEPTEEALAREDVIGFEASGDVALAETEPKSTNREVMLQLLTPPHPNGNNGAWTIDQLLTQTLRTQDLVFTQMESSLILQLPRYGKRQRVIGDVVPDPVLYVSTAGAHRLKIMYQLRAVIVIGTSHFVSYLRVPKGKRGNVLTRMTAAFKDDQHHSECTWLYYDSMSDRVAEQNVPLIMDVTEELGILEFPNASSLVGAEMAQPGREHLKRVVQDMSVAFYCRVGSQELERAY